MSSNGTGADGGVVVVDGALSAASGAVDALQGVDWSVLSDDEVVQVVSRVEVLRRRLPSLDHALVVELEVRSVAATHLLRGTAHLLAQQLHVDVPEARARVRAATELGPRTALGGQPLDPVHPATAAAQAAGLISEKHATVITGALEGLPRSLDPEVVAAAEATLAGHATHLSPAELCRAADRLTTHLDPDGMLSEDTDRQRRRHLTLGQQGGDAMTPVRGLLTPECRALLDAAITALARPTPAAGIAGDTALDPRSAGQRNHDALGALCSQLLSSNALPTNRGLPATVVITMTLDQLETAMATTSAATDTAAGGSGQGAGQGGCSGQGGDATGSRRAPNPDGATARTATGTLLPLPDALRLATRAHPVLAVFDRGGQPLYLSRVARLATPHQRLALTARDRGCTRPGCDAPPAWCEVHHLTGWQQGGTTNIANLALVCPFDHHLITDTGYTVGLGPRGRIQWTPPPRLDPDQTPRTNPLHHPPDLTTHHPPEPGHIAAA